jgi:hypothetical protein
MALWQLDWYVLLCNEPLGLKQADEQKNASHLVASTFSSLSTARPPSNPRANLAWRAVDKAATPQTPNVDLEDQSQVEGDDVAMDGEGNGNAQAGPSRVRSTAPGGAATDSTGDEESAVPDMQLLSALHSTSLAMEELSKRSAERARAGDRDPREELRRIEVQLLGSSMITLGSAARDRGPAGNARLDAVRAQHGGGLAGSTPGSTNLGHTPGRQQASSPVVGR